MQRENDNQRPSGVSPNERDWPMNDYPPNLGGNVDHSRRAPDSRRLDFSNVPTGPRFMNRPNDQAKYQPNAQKYQPNLQGSPKRILYQPPRRSSFSRDQGSGPRSASFGAPQDTRTIYDSSHPNVEKFIPHSVSEVSHSPNWSRTSQWPTSGRPGADPFPTSPIYNQEGRPPKPKLFTGSNEPPFQSFRPFGMQSEPPVSQRERLPHFATTPHNSQKRPFSGHGRPWRPNMREDSRLPIDRPGSSTSVGQPMFNANAAGYPVIHSPVSQSREPGRTSALSHNPNSTLTFLNQTYKKDPKKYFSSFRQRLEQRVRPGDFRKRSGSNATEFTGPMRSWGSNSKQRLSAQTQETLQDALEALKQGTAPLLSPRISTKNIDTGQRSLSQSGIVIKDKMTGKGSFIRRQLQPMETELKAPLSTFDTVSPEFAFDTQSSIPEMVEGKPSSDDSIASTPTPEPSPMSDVDQDEEMASVDESVGTPPTPMWPGGYDTQEEAFRLMIYTHGEHDLFRRKAIITKVEAQNQLLVESARASEGGPRLKRVEVKLPDVSASEMRSALVSMFERKEREQQQKMDSLRSQYRSLYLKWQRRCRMLEDKLPPEEPISESIGEPLSARGNRRNRNSNVISSQLELELVLEKSADDSKVDADLLARANAAKIPDMISVTGQSHEQYIYTDTNSLVYNADQFYDYRKEEWTEEEHIIFEQLLADVGKKFGIIAEHPGLQNRSIQDCVRYYYGLKADDKYKQLLGTSTKRKGAKRTMIVTQTGGLLADIRAEERKAEKPAEDEEEEDEDSSYEVEKNKRKPGRGRGRGRGRGGWRGGPRTTETTRELSEDIEMEGIPADASGDEANNPHSKTPNPRRRFLEWDTNKGISPRKPTKVISSYWHVADRERMVELIEKYGEDYEAISGEISQKSAVQVRNYIKGKPELASVLERVTRPNEDS